MCEHGNIWALMLAAGEGTRLRGVATSPSGTMVPKQFCSLEEGPSPLQEALSGAHAVTSNSHTSAIPAEHHRRW